MQIFIEDKEIELINLNGDNTLYRGYTRFTLLEEAEVRSGSEWYIALREYADDIKLCPIYGIPRDRIEDIADEIGYAYQPYEESWLDYCDSIENDCAVTEDQIRAELLEFKSQEA